MTELSEAAIAGKCLVIYVAGGDPRQPTVVEASGLVEFAGRMFVVGKEVARIGGVENWLSGAETYIAVESISLFHLFENLEEYESRISDDVGADPFELFDENDPPVTDELLSAIRTNPRPSDAWQAVCALGGGAFADRPAARR